MDKLFLYEPDEMIKKIKVIEPEMREDSYGEITEGLDTTSRNALAYIFEIFSYMKKNWNIDQCTVLALMKELYRIASTGEYSYLQDFEKISYKDDVFEHMWEEAGKSEILYAGTETIEGVDTGKILFILGGAFPRIDELEKEKDRNPLGFNAATECKVNIKESVRDQMLAIGGEVEFIGRIEDIIRLHKLTRDELKTILMDEHIGIFTKKKKIYNDSGLDLIIEEDTVEAIVDLIVKENAGARSVKNIMNQFADNAYFYDMKVGGYSCMKIHQYTNKLLFDSMKCVTQERKSDIAEYESWLEMLFHYSFHYSMEKDYINNAILEYKESKCNSFKWGSFCVNMIGRLEYQIIFCILMVDYRFCIGIYSLKDFQRCIVVFISLIMKIRQI